MALPPLEVPLPKSTSIDPLAFGRLAASPAIAKEQRRQRLFETISQLPTQILQGIVAGRAAREQRNLLAAKIRETKPLKEIAPQLAKAYPSIADLPSEQALKILPSLIKEKKDVQEIALYDPSTGTIIGTVPKGAKPAKIPSPITKEEEKQQTFVKEAYNLLNEAESTLGKVPSGLIFGGFEQLKGATGQGGAIAASYDSTRKALATKIYRGLTGDTRLSDADAAARALPLVPPITDAKNVRDFKFERLRKILKGDVPNPFVSLQKQTPEALGFK